MEVSAWHDRIGRMSLRAVIFDFDGLIFDSETPIYEAAASVLAEMGHSGFTEAQWSRCVGLGEDDAWAELCKEVGENPNRDEFESRFRATDQSWRQSHPALPGVEQLLLQLADAHIACGVASSSSASWVEGTLARLGLRHWFSIVACQDKVAGLPKPAPDLYNHAIWALGTSATQSVALEDSAPGIAAANAAGMAVVAVPNSITIHTDLSAADHKVSELTELTVAALDALVGDARA